MSAEKKVVHITPVEWAEHIAAAEQRGAERALREAADDMLRDDQVLDRHRRARWLRERAERVEES